MLGHRELGIDDYVAIIRRRLWVFVIPALIGPVLAYVISLTLTPAYTSEALILIEQPKVPESFVKSVVTSDLIERLATMQEQILSRSRLQPIIERYNLYRTDARRGASMEDLVDKMRKDVSVSPTEFANQGKKGGRSSETVPGFNISFRAESARLAQQVCTDLTSMFMEENIRQREERAKGTTRFLQTQVAEAKQKLDEADAKLAEFKRRNIGALPDEQQTNLQMLGSLSTQLGTVTDDLNRIHQARTYTESMLNQQLEAWKALPRGSSQAPGTDSLEQQLAKEKDYLVGLEARYTSDHPDVIKAKADIAQLQREIDAQGAPKAATADAESEGTVAEPVAPSGRPAEAESENAAIESAAQSGKPDHAKSGQKTVEPASIQKLRALLLEQDEGMRQKAAEQARVQQRINAIEGRLQVSPIVEQQFKDITRDYQTALQFYNSLLAKTNESEMSTDLEQRQEGEQFKVLDSPNLPQDPSFPIWWQFALGGLAAGLFVGTVIALLQEMRDKAIRDERDIEFYLELPALALVPSLEKTNGGKPRATWRKTKREALLREGVKA